ncbi:MAG: hypothetical protein QOJ99_1405 [Bryobacterales bacterium]|jgi:hypothetical protein|nr:hypothetical protein [Bryobacterales bacterium]
MPIQSRSPIFLAGAFLLLCPSFGAGDVAPGSAIKIKPGELIIDPPTLINLGFEWLIDGDDNHNSQVEVSYRKQGETQWKQGLPLLRLHGERIYQNQGVFDVVSPNMFAGSILDLEPNTAYEARFVMSDADGFQGQSAKAVTRVVTARTRPEPMPAPGGRVFHVYPSDYKGAKLEPAFDALMCAYNYYCGGGDTVTAGQPRVKSGDMILVHAGTYKYHPEYYTGDRTINATTPVEGTYYLTASGTPERPIVIKGAGDGEVIFDGNGNFNLFNVKAASYNYFEGITIRNTDIAIWAGTQFIAGSKGLTVKRCRFENVNLGILANYSGSSNFYIADNYFIGRDDSKHLFGWIGAYWAKFAGIDGQKFPPVLASYTAVRLYGPGHVVAYNYVADFHDGIDIETYGNPDGSHALDGPHYPPREYRDRRPVSIDFYNNYMTNFHDNAFEIDGSMHNVRVMRNMMVNSASHPFCNQPAIGGPVYWIRNIAYHAPGGSTRMTNGAAGVLFYNNTILTETSAGSSANVHWRNNLMLGENSAPAIFSVNTNTNYSSSDYNGFRPNPGAAYSFQWSSPPPNTQADYSGMLLASPQCVTGRTPGNPALEERRFGSLAEYVQAVHQDQHSVVLDYDVFMNVPRLDAQDVKTVQELYNAADLDFRPRPGSAAIDHGMVLPNVTDGYAGAAPDLGALEAGQAPPHYGPRP